MTKLINNEKIITESDKARQRFIDKDLTYKDITYSDFLLLYWTVQKAFEKHNKLERQKPKHERNYLMKVAQKPQYIKGKTGMKKAFIKVVCDNYTTREAISFNENGFIGFAGWADSHNIKPITRAFMYWASAIAIGKRLKKEARLKAAGLQIVNETRQLLRANWLKNQRPSRHKNDI